MLARTVLALSLAGALAACANPAANLQPLPASAIPTASSYQLGAGDSVRVVVGGFTNISNDYNVSDVGTISLPMIGVMDVTGKSTGELETAIAEFLTANELAVNPSVSVQVEKYRPFYILGEVRRPGAYPYVPGMNVLTAVSIAGGHTFRAETDDYGINRPVNGQTIKARGTEDTVILPGDTVIVFESTF